MATLSETFVKTLGNISQFPLSSGLSLLLVLVKQPRDLPEDTKNILFKAYLPIISAAFNEKEPTEDSLKDHYVHMFENDFLFLLLQEHNEEYKPIATYALKSFTFVNLLKPESTTSVLYLHSSVVDPSQQKQGIFTELLKYTAKLYGGRADFFSLRTQNPSVFKCIKSVFGDKIYPIPLTPTNEIQKIGAEVAEKLNMKPYIADKMVGVRIYLTHVGQGVKITKQEDLVAQSVRDHLNSVDGADAILFVMPF
eukprot:Phypoly_transcript_06275.p1 GENE.Phypoly_transcript_06275~~Phypoly_transcript_06275.p1  ORF type:complete len:252 (+),score=29.67 Phypoly_transcript_06275:1048-1803(+)